MAYLPSVTFRESPLGPWGASKSSGVQIGSILRGATPPAQTRPTESIGCISNINAYLSEAGLPRRNNLPPLILDLSKDIKEEEVSDSGEEDMSSKRGGKYAKRRTRNGEQPKDTSEINTVQEDKCADTQLIEMAAYPGYSPDKPTPLPHNLDSLEQMKRVTRAHAKLSTKARKFREAWCQLFYSKYSQEMFLDYYWWFFLHRYQPGHHVSIQDSLFTRISENYVKLLCQPIELKWRDTHFKMYPDAIAQCVYSTFVCAYPNSWNNFDESFKNELSLCITLWQVGTRPLPGLWTKWNMALLEPPNLLKNVGKEKETGSQKKSPQRLPAPDQLQGNENDDMEIEGEVSSEFKRLSIDEVRKTLDSSAETLVPLVRHNHRKHEKGQGGGVAPSASEEKRIGLARKQFQALEKCSKSQKELCPTSQAKYVSPCKSDPSLQSQKTNHLNSKWQQLPTESKGTNVSSGNLNVSKQTVQPLPSVGNDSKQNVQLSQRVWTNPTVQPSPRLGSNPKPSPRLGNASKTTFQPSPRTGSGSKHIVRPSPGLGRAFKKTVQPSPRIRSASKCVQPSPRAPQPKSYQATQGAKKATSLSKSVNDHNSQPESKPQQHPSTVIKQDKVSVSPADELINRAKAKIGALRDMKPNQTPGTVQQTQTPPQRIAGSNNTTLNQAKYKSTSNQGTRATTTAKHPEARAAATQKDMPPCGRTERTILQAKRRTMPTGRPILQAKRRTTTASQTTPLSKDAASQSCSDLLHANSQGATSQTCSHDSSQNANDQEASTQVRVNVPAPSKDATAQTKNEKAIASLTTTALPTPQRSRGNDQLNETSPASPITSKSVYQQACTELKEMALAFKERTTEEILSSIKGPEFEHVLFNFHGHSPLVKHYIRNTRRTHMNEKESIVGRTEIEEQPEKAACYQDILAESKRSSEKNHAMFQRYYELQKQVLTASKKKRLDEQHKHEENVKLVLANKREVQQLSNELMLCEAQRKDLDRSERSNAIQKVLDRVNNH